MPPRRTSSRAAGLKKPAANTLPSAPSLGTDSLEIKAFPDDAAFEAWLRGHHDTCPGLWLKIAKKATGIPTVTYDGALDVALCWGWIDGQRKPLDGSYFLQRFTRRRKGGRSLWSKRNVAKVADLTEQGRMQQPGQREVDAAKEDGRWEQAYSGQSAMEVPDDFAAALGADKGAESFFASLSKSQRYGFLRQVQTAVKLETRQRRIEKYVQMLGEGKTL